MFDFLKKKKSVIISDNWSNCTPTLPISKDSNSRKKYFSTGIGRKIVDIKASYSLNNSIVFESDSDFEKYKLYENEIIKAVELMIAYGKSFLVVGDGNALQLGLSSGKQIKSYNNEILLYNEDVGYFFGNSMQTIDTSRVVEFAYHQDLRDNTYLSEFDLIWRELENDYSLQLYCAEAIKKNSTVFYKVKGYNSSNALSAHYQQGLMRRLETMENMRSVFGASVIDQTDEDVATVSQTLPDLAAADAVSLRRLAMVTRIPLPILVGESVQGLNSSGNVESETFDDMIRQIQHRYLFPALRSLFDKIGIGKFSFKKNFRDNTTDILKQQQLVLQNAQAMQDLGMSVDDVTEYIRENLGKTGL